MKGVDDLARRLERLSKQNEAYRFGTRLKAEQLRAFEEAHALSHVVKDRLMADYPQIVDAVIHIEPPPASAP